MEENGGRSKTTRLATGRPATEQEEKWGNGRKCKTETREDFGDLWCLGLVNDENGKV